MTQQTVQETMRVVMEQTLKENPDERAALQAIAITISGVAVGVAGILDTLNEIKALLREHRSF